MVGHFVLQVLLEMFPDNPLLAALICEITFYIFLWAIVLLMWLKFPSASFEAARQAFDRKHWAFFEVFLRREEISINIQHNREK